MDMYHMIREYLDNSGYEDWEVGTYGDTLICPCGNEIETDGDCPEGCESPLKTIGIL